MPKRSKRFALTVTIGIGALCSTLVGFILGSLLGMPVWAITPIVAYMIVVAVVGALIGARLVYRK